MKIYSFSGEVPFKVFAFPDGQQHVEILQMDGPYATIEARIANASELMEVLLAKAALDTFGCYVDLDIRYMLGARMDKRIGIGHPNTLEIVCRQIMSAGFRRIRVFDPHSPICLRLLRAEAVMPTEIVNNILSNYQPLRDVVIVPDAGASARVKSLVNGEFRLMQATKHRDSQTGKLSEFTVEDVGFVDGKGCLIIDDICDGGGTFSGLADVLEKAGAQYVDLFVTHGIFSKGAPLPGIRKIYTTNSYRYSAPSIIPFHVCMKDLK